MILRTSFVFFVFFIMMSAVFLERAVQIPMLFLAGSLFSLTILIEPRFRRLRYVQFLLLPWFHWLSHLNWCIMLYYFMAGKEAYRKPALKRSVLVSVATIGVYSIIRLSYSEHTTYNLMVTIYDQCSMLGALSIVYYLVISRDEKRKLRIENKHLLTHDPLTGLLNFQEFNKQLEHLLFKKQQIGLLLIDCLDLKTMNNEQGFLNGDKLLKQSAEIFQSLFMNSYILARYGGDKFAVVLEWRDPEQQLLYIDDLLSSEIPSSVGIHVTFGYASSPEDGTSKDEILQAAERRLFAMKRDNWLRREEHMIRSEKLKLIGELAAGLAHEIRNPLTTIRGFMQIAKENQYNIEPWYPVLMEEITRISELTGEFLQFSKPHIVKFKPQSLGDCVNRVIQLMESEAALMGHIIHVEAPQEPIIVMMDKDKIVQLVLNLIKNAFEAMQQPGSVTLTLQKHSEQEEALLIIQDTGPGISAEDLEKVFNPFFTTKKNGTGLGLSICHKIVQDHGGTITVTSSSEGTCFRLKFPLAQELTGYKEGRKNA